MINSTNLPYLETTYAHPIILKTIEFLSKYIRYFVRAWISGYESTAPVAAIMGPREQSVASGSTITLRCVILSPYQTRPIRGVQWLRDNKLLTFQVMHSSASSRETDSNEIFYTEPFSLFRPSTTNSRESLQRKKHDHKSSCRCRDDNRSSYSTPFPYFSRFFFARIEFHFLPCGEVLMKSRY